ncbi:MAG: heavy-metal-associated domain-containing protein, partial [bacterium]
MESGSDRQRPGHRNPEIHRYPLTYRHARIPVEGISCASCVRRIEKGLEGLEGVEEVAVNLASGEVALRYDPQSCSLD